jgi:hypothetical protein
MGGFLSERGVENENSRGITFCVLVDFCLHLDPLHSTLPFPELACVVDDGTMLLREQFVVSFVSNARFNVRRLFFLRPDIPQKQPNIREEV